MYSMEWSLGAESCSGVKFRSGKNSLHLHIQFRHHVFYGAEYWSGVESDFGVAKVEWSAIVMCVCVAKFYAIL